MLQIAVTNAVAVATTAVASIVSEVSFAAVAATVASNAEAFVVVVLFFLNYHRCCVLQRDYCSLFCC